MTSSWNTVRPTIIQFDGRSYQVPDHVAFNWMHSGSACAHIKYAYCIHPEVAQAVVDPWQYDDYWNEWINLLAVNVQTSDTERSMHHG